jgi:hypothetical protein
MGEGKEKNRKGGGGEVTALGRRRKILATSASTVLSHTRKAQGGARVKEKKSLNLFQIIYIVQQFKKCTPVFQENHVHHVVQDCSIPTLEKIP